MEPTAVETLITASQELAAAGDGAEFGAPVSYVYNPLQYGGAAHRRYISTYAKTKLRAAFVGMNPGPFGMVQTGIPFGDVQMVRNWLGIDDGVDPPKQQHPQRPVLGFNCTRREVSGSRLWGLFSDRFGTAERFFAENFVLNYCPLAFLTESGRNLTPDKLIGPSMSQLIAACDRHLQVVVGVLKPKWVVALGVYAERRVREALPEDQPIVRLLHPSPASPRANAGWAEQATQVLIDNKIWT